MTAATLTQQDIREATIAKNKAVFALAEELYGLDMSAVAVRFDLKGKAAGQAYRRGANYGVRYNLPLVQHNDSLDNLLNDTVPHEVAHIVCFMNPKLGKNHDAGWARVCRELGGSGDRCHSEEVVNAKGKTYKVRASCGTEITLGEAKFMKLRRVGATLKRTGGKINMDSPYKLIGVSGKFVHFDWQNLGKQTVITPESPKSIVRAVPEKSQTLKPAHKSTGKVTKADKIREWIRQGRSELEIIKLAVDLLGMKPQLAKTYYKNNLNKA